MLSKKAHSQGRRNPQSSNQNGKSDPIVAIFPRLSEAHIYSILLPRPDLDPHWRLLVNQPNFRISPIPDHSLGKLKIKVQDHFGKRQIHFSPGKTMQQSALRTHIDRLAQNKIICKVGALPKRAPKRAQALE